MSGTRPRTIIVGAGPGGLVFGLWLKKACPEHDVVLYDRNAKPGGYCTSFTRTVQVGDRAVQVPIDFIRYVCGFGPGEEMDLMLAHLGVSNLRFEPHPRLFQYIVPGRPVLQCEQLTADALRALAADAREARALTRLLDAQRRLFFDLTRRFAMDPSALQVLKALICMPRTLAALSSRATYAEKLASYGLRSRALLEMLGLLEDFLGTSVEQVSALAYMMVLQAFMESSVRRPVAGDGLAMLAHRMADRFRQLGGRLVTGTIVDRVVFDRGRAVGVECAGTVHRADTVVLAVQQDGLARLLADGEPLAPVRRVLRKLRRLGPSYSAMYVHDLYRRRDLASRPDLLDHAVTLYRLPAGQHPHNRRLEVWFGDPLTWEDEYCCMGIHATVQDHDLIADLVHQRRTDPAAYRRRKQTMAEDLRTALRAVEPHLADIRPAATVVTLTPASFEHYGTPYAIAGLAQTPDNAGMYRLRPQLLPSLYLAGSSVFLPGIYGACTGGWLAFQSLSRRRLGTRIGRGTMLFDPGLENLP
jgi:phytoene dehydrogenase-like protein